MKTIMKARKKQLLAATAALAAGLCTLAVSAQENTGRHEGEPRSTQEDRIYGSQMMTARERAAYRTRMRKAGSEESRAQIRAEHRRTMQERAAMRKRQESGAARQDRAPGARRHRTDARGQHSGCRQAPKRRTNDRQRDRENGA